MKFQTSSKLGRGRGLFAPEPFLFILVALSIVLLLGLIVMLLFLPVLACVYAMYSLICRRRAERAKLFAKTKAQAEARLCFIQKLITLAYETDKELFHQKFRFAVCADELRNAGVVEVDCAMIRKNISMHAADNEIGQVLTEKDMELCCLLLHGFSYPELAVVYNLKSVNYAYTKRHRLKNKLDSLGVENTL